MVCIGLIPFGKHLLNFVEIKHISQITRFLRIVFLDLIYRLLNLPTHSLIVVSSCLLRPVTEDHLCEEVTMRENSTFFTFTSWNRSGRIMTSLASFKARDWFSTFGYCGHIGDRLQFFRQSQKYLQDISHSHVDIDNLKLKGHVDEDVFAGKCYSVF